MNVFLSFANICHIVGGGGGEGIRNNEMFYLPQMWAETFQKFITGLQQHFPVCISGQFVSLPLKGVLRNVPVYQFTYSLSTALIYFIPHDFAYCTFLHTYCTVISFSLGDNWLHIIKQITVWRSISIITFLIPCNSTMPLIKKVWPDFFPLSFQRFYQDPLFRC